jgi:hypothetical protein
MKTQKLKNHSIYKVINCGRGDEFYLDFKPSKSELKELCCREFCWEEKSFNEEDVLCYKLDILSKK